MTAPIGIIGGTALSRLPGMQEIPADTPYGPPSGPLLAGGLAGRDVVFLMRHGPGHTLAPHAINYRANLRALANVGVQQVIAVAAVGGITDAMTPGRIAIPHQLIDYSWGRAHSFHDAHSETVEHIDFTEPYDQPLRQALLGGACGLGFKPADSAVYGVTQGPRLETAAEIDRLERDGCDLVGMTGMPEAALAREAGLAYACLAVVVNRAAGRGGDIHADMEKTVTIASDNALRVVQAALPALG